MHLKYFVGGVNGVGKSTLVKAIAKKRPNFRVVKGSERFMKWLGIPGDYETLRNLPQEVKSIEWLKCLEGILNETFEADQDLILDAHFLNLVNGQTSIVTDYWLDSFDAAVLITASAEEIYSRVKKDERDRALFDDKSDELYMIRNYLDATEAQYKYCLRNYDLTGMILNHPENGTELAVQEFLEFDTRLRNP